MLCLSYNQWLTKETDLDDLHYPGNHRGSTPSYYSAVSTVHRSYTYAPKLHVKTKIGGLHEGKHERSRLRVGCAPPIVTVPGSSAKRGAVVCSGTA